MMPSLTFFSSSYCHSSNSHLSFASGEAFMVLPTDVWGQTYHVFSMPDLTKDHNKYHIYNGSQFSK